MPPQGSCHVSISQSRIAKAYVSEAALARSPCSTSGANQRGLLGAAPPPGPLEKALRLKSQTCNAEKVGKQSAIGTTKLERSHPGEQLSTGRQPEQDSQRRKDSSSQLPR